MPKLLDREPTQEMLKAIAGADCAPSNYKRMFQAAYDAAPEMKQDPFGYVREIRPMEWKFSKTTSWGPEVWKPVFTFPIDDQAEIAKRDARIAELEADQDKANAAVAIGNYLGKTYNYAWCDTSLASQTIDLLKEQSAEIARLKGVLAKCKETLVSNISDLQEPNFVTLASWRVKEALAAIKEIEYD